MRLELTVRSWAVRREAAFAAGCACTGERSMLASGVYPWFSYQIWYAQAEVVRGQTKERQAAPFTFFQLAAQVIFDTLGVVA